MKIYEGGRFAGETIVTVNGKPLNPRLDLRNHSPDGFEWGYGGSGPAQLALALLADHMSDDDKALRLYPSFKAAVIASFPCESWRLTSDQIDQTLKSLQ